MFSASWSRSLPVAPISFTSSLEIDLFFSALQWWLSWHLCWSCALVVWNVGRPVWHLLEKRHSCACWLWYSWAIRSFQHTGCSISSILVSRWWTYFCRLAYGRSWTLVLWSGFGKWMSVGSVCSWGYHFLLDRDCNLLFALIYLLFWQLHIDIVTFTNNNQI